VDDVQGSESLGPYRDAYLAPFERYAPRAELEAGLDDALRLGWVSRVLASDPQFDSAERRRARLKMFLQEPIE
jgi:hypothetical protein